MSNIPRTEYPRPSFVREAWMTLNGAWRFSFDEPVFDREIQVPFVYQAPLSGINMREFHDTVWYEREFTLPEALRGKQILLHFGAVDYHCRVWVNGIHIGEHTGGQIGFTFDVSHALNTEGANTLRVQATDPVWDLDIPRGKQFWEETSRSIFYTPSTGIWQSVWLEGVNPDHISRVLITPLLDERSVKFEYELAGSREAELQIEIYYEGCYVTSTSVQPQGHTGAVTVLLDQTCLGAWNFVEDLTWSPENPRLFDVQYTVKVGGKAQDSATSYFGMRKVSVTDGVFMLNNRPYFQRLVLDQGYWPDGLLSAPSDEAYIKDIKLTKAMGFNGVRKHQKVEDPRFLYHADKIGLLVWGEMASAYVYTRRYAQSMAAEWLEAVQRDYNHPCIVVWTPLNESWGVQEIGADKKISAHCQAMYHLTKSLDDTRLVVDNDGWEHVGGDLLTIHDYAWQQDTLTTRYSSVESTLQAMPAGRPLYTAGSEWSGQPILVTEFGGISYEPQTHKEESGWGYSAAATGADFLARYKAVVQPMYDSPCVQGFCYTQLTDVEQESNGLLTYGRDAKVDLEALKKITIGEG